MKKTNFHLLFFLTIIYLIALISKGDLFRDNLSTLTQNIYGYLAVSLLGILIAIIVYNGTKDTISPLIRRLLTVFILLCAFFPYSDKRYLADIHIIIAYSTFAFLTTLTLRILYHRSVFMKKDRYILAIYLFMLMLILALTLHFLAVNALIELLYLGVTIIIYAYDYAGK